jgi:hypothetical protein
MAKDILIAQDAEDIYKDMDIAIDNDFPGPSINNQ